MRELKFRAWDHITKEMIYFDLSKFSWDDIAHCQIMQFTGRKDKTGKDIYEGDIVIVTTPAENQMQELKHDTVVIKWYPQLCGFFLGYINNKMCDYYEYQVIDNVYEAPNSYISRI